MPAVPSLLVSVSVLGTRYRWRSKVSVSVVSVNSGIGLTLEQIRGTKDQVTFLLCYSRPAACSAWNHFRHARCAIATGIGIGTRYRWRSKVSVSVVSVNSGIGLTLEQIRGTKDRQTNIKRERDRQRCWPTDPVRWNQRETTFVMPAVPSLLVSVSVLGIGKGLKYRYRWYR